MQMRVSGAESAVLHGLLEEKTGEIFVKIDAAGFIEAASPNISQIRQDYSQLLFKPHLAELADGEHSAALREKIAAVLLDGAGENDPIEWLEFPSKVVPHQSELKPSGAQDWYALRLRVLKDDFGCVMGAFGLLRAIEHRQSHQGESHTCALVDPLTGLANRHAFCASLREQIGKKESGFIALFEVDKMRAIFMQYGQRTVDEIILGFAQFLEAMLQDGYQLAQFDAERFCVVLPEVSRKAGRRWVQEVLETFSSLALIPSPRARKLSASAGLARIEESVDSTLRQAELALVMARARGGTQVSECPRHKAIYARVGH